MDKKKLILITYDKLNSDHYKEELTNFFGDEIIIETQNILDGIKENLEGDVVLSLSPLTSNFLIKHFKEDIEIIHGTKALSKLGYEKMMKLPPGTKSLLATVYKGNIIKNLIMDCQSYTKYRPNETTGGIFVSWRGKEELPTGLD
ncbi:hypothetical protein [Clostridioides difficile]|uniref:hypothetical protein n=1 Tax=Clostridioides difficile TaxID=1496 RepID=UPI00097FD789|nr:hypothetical protein [Clostridioides difficile]SJP04959.1 Uncharacterised protein [Clostridioides difficile]